MKLSGNQIDNRLVEVHWDPKLSHWRMMRLRDDKPNGNHRSVVENIIQTIADGIEKETVNILFLPRCILSHDISTLAACTVSSYPKCVEGPSW